MTIIFDFVTSMKLCIVLKVWIAKFRIILKLCIMSIIFDFVMPMKLWITFLEVWVIFEALVYFEGLDCEALDFFLKLWIAKLVIIFVLYRRERKSLSVVQRKSFSVANANCFSVEQEQENRLFPRSIWGREQVCATRVLGKGVLFR